MKVPDGCAICGATWGNYWAEVEGQRMFFCCELCAKEFRNLISEIKRRTSWRSIDDVKLKGDQRQRECAAISGNQTYSFLIGFDSQGEIRIFQEKPA